MNTHTINALADAFNQALFVRCDSDLEIAYVWHGGTTINVYSLRDFTCVDYWIMSNLDGVSNLDGLKAVMASVYDAIFVAKADAEVSA